MLLTTQSWICEEYSLGSTVDKYRHKLKWTDIDYVLFTVLLKLGALIFIVYKVFFL